MNAMLVVGLVLVCVGIFTYLVVRRWPIDGTFSAIILEGALAFISGVVLIAWYFVAKL